jgi:hypothetical protein
VAIVKDDTGQENKVKDSWGMGGGKRKLEMWKREEERGRERS